MDTGERRTGEDAVRAALTRLAASELPYLDSVLRSYRLDPWPAGGEGGSDRPVGAGVPIDQLAAWTPMVIEFVAEVIAVVTVEWAAREAGTAARSSLTTWFGRRRRQKKLAAALSAPVPPIDETQRMYIRTLAVRAAAARGRPVAEQQAFATAVIEALDQDAAAAGGPAGER